MFGDVTRGEFLKSTLQSVATHMGAHQHHHFQSAGSILRAMPGDLVVSKQQLRRAEAIACVRLKRQEANQNLGFASRPFVLCGLPIKKPVEGQLLHQRRNGQFSLQVTGHPAFGLPWGQDRLIPIFLATLAIRQQSQVIQFRSAAEMLNSFGMQQGGTQYRRLVAAFQRIFGATIFFGTDTQSICSCGSLIVVSWQRDANGFRCSATSES